MLPEQIAIFLKNLTTEPGIYQMLDIAGKIIYVGKAYNLKKRISSYFTKKNNSIKTSSLLKQVENIEIIVTKSDTEALLLEANLIKANRPKYNILLRDDKSYPYIHFSEHPQFPSLGIYRSKKNPNKKNFYGPYPNVSIIRETINNIQKIFKIRNCTDNFFNSRSRPCLQYQIKRCSAPCVAYISPAEYQKSVHDAQMFIQGKSNLILDELSKKMEKSIQKLQFEDAAIFRDQIKSLRMIQEQQSIQATTSVDIDVIVIKTAVNLSCIYFVQVRNGGVVSNKSFFPEMPTLEPYLNDDNLWQEVFETFITWYYTDNPDKIPAMIVTHMPVNDKINLEALLSQLRKKQCKINFNPRGVKKNWLNFALHNLDRAYKDQSFAKCSLKNSFTVLQTLLKIKNPIHCIECFDISHTQGQFTVASCVNFNVNGPDKASYRHYNVKNIKSGDDYDAIYQVLLRRMTKQIEQENQLPELIIVDGGKGQLQMAVKVLKELQITSVTLIAIAKGSERKSGWERIYLYEDGISEVSLAADTEAFHLLQFIRNEAHRFAISFHRKKRQKSYQQSGLENIEGVGIKKRKALLQRFGGIKELAKAPLAEIQKITGINKVLALRIFNYFHQTE